MVLDITGILCLYFYYGTEAACMVEGRMGMKRSLHTTRLAVFWERQGIALHRETGFTYYRSAQGREAKQLGNMSILLKALYSWLTSHLSLTLC